jgi:amino ABC transporter, permease protein, 3-TM region, his/glu/gln/arg/opine family
MQQQLLNYQFMVKSFWKILSALPVTLNIAIVTMFFSLILSFFIAVVRINKVKILSKLAIIYVSFIRGTPLLVQIYLSYYGIPKFLNHMNAKFGWSLNVNNVPVIIFVYVAFILNMSAYMSETFRAAILSVEKGQMEAAISIGMSKWQAMRRIILPQAFVTALPNLGNSFISLIKDTSLAFVVSIVELMGKAKIVGAAGLNFFEVYIVVALIYWIVCIVMEGLLMSLEKMVRIGGQ